MRIRWRPRDIAWFGWQSGCQCTNVLAGHNRSSVWRRQLTAPRRGSRGVGTGSGSWVIGCGLEAHHGLEDQ